jgi:hypothetical protein
VGYARTKAERSAIELYARTKREWVARRSASRQGGGGTPDLLVDMLAPASPSTEEEFLQVFLAADDVTDVCPRLELEPRACAKLARALRPARDAVAAKLGQDSAAANVVHRFEEHARRVQLGAFLAQMSRFYGVADVIPPRLQVEVLIGPEAGTVATVIGDHVVLPVPTGELEDDELFDLMGVVVHEVGHRFLGALPEAQRDAVNQAIARCCGILQSHHANILDESTQTALGNVLFMNWAFPGRTSFERSLYRYEPDNDIPHAIDSYARVLVPVLARHLATDGAFVGVYLADALEQHRLLFEVAPRHHSRAGLVVANDARAEAVFRRQFWGRSRMSFALEETDAIAATITARPMVPRWLLLVGTEPAAAAEAERMGFLGVRELSERLAPGEACFRAHEPSNDDGWRFVVTARDLDGLRALLGELQQRRRMPATLCMGARAGE